MPKLITGQNREIILPTNRGKENDCFGYCVTCSQAKIEARQNGDGTKNSPLYNLFLYMCGLPEEMYVTFRYPRGRGKKWVK